MNKNSKTTTRIPRKSVKARIATKTHIADLAVDPAIAIAKASGFMATLFLGRGKFEKIEAPTLGRARKERDILNAKATNGRRAMVYAIIPEGRDILIPDEFHPGVAAKAAKTAKAVSTVSKVSKPAKGGPALGQRAQIVADAEGGKLPPTPDFSANTHTRFRPKLAALVELVKAKDIAGLEAFPINPISTSPKAMNKFRNLSVIALKAQAAKAKG